MSLPVILRPAADADIQTTHDALEGVQAGLGGRFVARVREVLGRIEAMPEVYGCVAGRAGGPAEEVPARGLLRRLRIGSRCWRCCTARETRPPGSHEHESAPAGAGRG